ncbi:MAG: hemolysin III family protein [Acidobacteriales bacterium]|nr:hemolysin III family protein [Terriglobales bacterium]
MPATTNCPQASPGEEVANSISHGVGAILSLAALVILVVLAAQGGTSYQVVAGAVYGASLVLLFMCSTFYHALTNERAKRVFRILDHCSIYVLIAGTYTPFALTALRPTVGWLVFGIVWGAAALGISLKPFLAGKARLLSTIAYLAMGWIIVLAWKPLVAAVNVTVLRLLISGGLAYTAGTAFYMLKSRVWAHPLWHLFVGAGATLHFFAVLALLPPR